jgi:hypothetical protein
MKIALHSVYREQTPGAPSVIDGLRDCGRHARRHVLTQDLDEADAILVTEAWRHLDRPFYALVRNSPIVERYPGKTFVYCDSDSPIYLMPGLYPSMSRHSRFSPSMRSCCYLQPEGRRFEQLSVPDIEVDLLFSFAGNVRTNRVRGKIIKLRHPRAVVKDVRPNKKGAPRSAMGADYWHLIARSKFVLCPRGAGLGTYRVFETLCAGRVPVIISDDWHEPDGPNWDSISVRVRSRDVAEIPRILEQLEPEFEGMSARARSSYRYHFATEALFDYVGDQLQSLLSRESSARWSRWQSRLLIDESKEAIRRPVKFGTSLFRAAAAPTR